MFLAGHRQAASGAADPNRRTDCYDERVNTGKPAGTVMGFPGAAGVVEGTVRVLLAPEDAARLGDGEILVTTVTNVGWTSLLGSPAVRTMP
jgi:pyruvate,water dikinase